MQGKLFVYSPTLAVAGYVQGVSVEPVPSVEWRDGESRSRHFLMLEGGARLYLSELGARAAIDKMRMAHVDGSAETLQI